MKVPNHIKQKLHRAAKMFAAASVIMSEVDEYFENKGIRSTQLRSGNGISLEEIEYGNDVTEQFCTWLENTPAVLLIGDVIGEYNEDSE